MATAIYPGTFDPITRGHLDIVERAGAIFEEVVVAVGTNPAKAPLFSLAERLDMARDETQHLRNVRVDSFEGLVIDYAKAAAPAVLLRGLRNASDLEAEFQMAFTNRAASGGIETVFLMPSPQYVCHASHLIKQIASGGGDLTSFVTERVSRRLTERLDSGGSR